MSRLGSYYLGRIPVRHYTEYGRLTLDTRWLSLPVAELASPGFQQVVDVSIVQPVVIAVYGDRPNLQDVDLTASANGELDVQEVDPEEVLDFLDGRK